MKTPPVESTAVNRDGYRQIPVKNLLLDPHNPRLADYGLGDEPKQFDILKTLWERMAVAEVAMSIAWNGYFPDEILFVEKGAKDKFTVIEGNRRFSAVQLLLDPDLREKLRATDLPDIDKTPGIPKTRRKELENLPCKVTSREELWRYLGFKHVNGPVTWGAYAKAQYIAKIHNDYKIPLEDIAKQIGDYNNTVERWYHGLMVVQQAEKAKVFDRADANRKRGFEFSHIYEGLSREGVQQFLGLTGASRTLKEPVPKKNTKQLGELLEWIYGSKAKGTKPLMRTQAEDIDKLSQTLMSPDGVHALRMGLTLDMARDAAVGDEHLLNAAMNGAKRNLQDAAGLVTTGFDPNDGRLFTLSRDVADIANEVAEAMLKKRTKHRRDQREAGDA